MLRADSNAVSIFSQLAEPVKRKQARIARGHFLTGSRDSSITRSLGVASSSEKYPDSYDCMSFSFTASFGERHPPCTIPSTPASEKSSALKGWPTFAADTVARMLLHFPNVACENGTRVCSNMERYRKTKREREREGKGVIIEKRDSVIEHEEIPFQTLLSPRSPKHGMDYRNRDILSGNISPRMINFGRI